MTFPSDPVPTPDVVATIAAGREVRAVWRNELGGLTFRIGRGEEFVKTGPGDFRAEALRLEWAGRHIVVPRVLGVGSDWLHTAGLPGYSGVDPRWAEDPAVVARAAGRGLRVLHDRLPVDSCPFDWSVSTRLHSVAPHARPGLAEPPAVDLLVVCHGDACTPNTLIGADGQYCGHVDLDALGVADRWADLAVAAMSLEWNFTGSWESELLGAYGIEPDAIRLDYYRRLWEAPEIDGS